MCVYGHTNTVLKPVYWTSFVEFFLILHPRIAVLKVCLLVSWLPSPTVRKDTMSFHTRTYILGFIIIYYHYTVAVSKCRFFLESLLYISLFFLSHNYFLYNNNNNIGHYGTQTHTHKKQNQHCSSLVKREIHFRSSFSKFKTVWGGTVAFF